MISRKEFDEEEQIAYLTFREQFALVLAIDIVLGKIDPIRITPEMRERLENAREKMKAEVNEAFKELESE